MSEENLQKIEAAADRILAEVGMDIRDDDECLAMFRKAGAKVDGMRVRFEPGHLREILKTAPPNSPSTPATRHVRCRSAATTWCSAPAYGSPFVMDLDRAGATARWKISRISSSWRLCLPLAAPFGRHGLRADRRAGEQAPSGHGLRAHAVFRQGLHGLDHRRKRAEDSIEMSRLLFGADFVDRTASSWATSTSTRPCCGTAR
jgi:trimethylamine--corrinoid protein Co-methyltransferase